MGNFAVIVPAAGAGERFGGKQNKIFEKIKTQPVFLRTLEAFTSRDDVCQVLLAVAGEQMDEMKSRYGGHLGFMGVAIVEGGPTRPQSVRNALNSVADEAEFVAVHDAVRPCISPLWIDAVFAEAEKTGAAILAYPVHGTLKKVSEKNTIEQTAPRSGLWEAQTPQVFRKDILVAAYAGDIENITDDAQLVEAAGHSVSVVMGDPRNVKITTKADLALVRAVISTLPKPKRKGPDHPFAEAQW
ncbi:MAG: 2-C-methyl-D-erythritol 4-phosphate cytidylyltransferase [Planctomycetota bacterium]|jgi:2-C-methyl-D-erythritol 4-phosphate cytidylyltransferase